MSDINLLLTQNPNFKFVKVTFPNGNQKYTYKTLEEVEAGQSVVVDTPSNGLQVVEVTDVCQLHQVKLNPHTHYKWVVQVIDTTKHDLCVERENEAQQVLNNAKTKTLVETMKEELESKVGKEAIDTVQKLVRL